MITFLVLFQHCRFCFLAIAIASSIIWISNLVSDKSCMRPKIYKAAVAKIFFLSILERTSQKFFAKRINVSIKRHVKK